MSVRHTRGIGKERKCWYNMNLGRTRKIYVWLFIKMSTVFVIGPGLHLGYQLNIFHHSWTGLATLKFVQIIISPLLSIIEDQVSFLTEHNIPLFQLFWRLCSQIIKRAMSVCHTWGIATELCHKNLVSRNGPQKKVAIDRISVIVNIRARYLIWNCISFYVCVFYLFTFVSISYR